MVVRRAITALTRFPVHVVSLQVAYVAVWGGVGVGIATLAEAIGVAAVVVVALACGALLFVLHKLVRRVEKKAAAAGRERLGVPGTVLNAFRSAARTASLLMLPFVLAISLGWLLAEVWERASEWARAVTLDAAVTGSAPAGVDRWLEWPWGARDWLAGVVGVALTVFLIGAILEVAYSRVLVRYMNRRAREDHTTAVSRRKATPGALKRSTVDSAGTVEVQGAARGIRRRNRTHLRRLTIGFVGAPLAWLVAVLGSADLPPIESFVSGPLEARHWTVLYVVVGFVVAMAACAVYARGSLRSRTPFRQVHTVLSLVIGSFGTLFAAALPLLAFFGASPKTQWGWVSFGTRAAESAVLSRHTVFVGAFVLVAEVDPSLPDAYRGGEVSALLAGAAVYAAFAAIVWLWIRWRARRGRPVHLVFLRVFGDSGRGRFLVDRVAPRWLGIGNVVCIAAPDVATFQIDVHAMIDLLFLRLGDRFVADGKSGDEYTERYLGHSTAQFAIRELYCFDDTWRLALRRLLSVDNGVALMDLRGFSTENQGCVFELHTLVDRFPLRRLVFMIDDSTDVPLLEDTLVQAWESMSASSPNAQADAGRATMFRIHRADSRSAKKLANLLYGAAARIHG